MIPGPPPLIKPTYVYVQIKGTSDGTPFELRQAFEFPHQTSTLFVDMTETPLEVELGLPEPPVHLPDRVRYSLRLHDAERVDPPREVVPKFRKGKCPVCGHKGSVTGLGVMWPHNDRRGADPRRIEKYGYRCEGSGKEGVLA